MHTHIILRCFYSFFSVNATDETRLVVQALRVNTLSKLTFADSKRFDALVKDIFPGVDFKGIEYAELADAFREAAKESNLIAMETQVRLSIKCGARTEAPMSSYLSAEWLSVGFGQPRVSL